MVVERPVAEVMTTPLISVRPDTPLQDAVKLLSEHHISGLPVLSADGALVGELSEQDLMVRESGFDAGPYVMLLDAVIYLRNPLDWDKQVHQVLGNSVGDVMNSQVHTCAAATPLPQAARQLHEAKVQRLFVLDGAGRPVGVLTRGDVVRALAAAG
ncbi:MAG: CBS domain-containing protein [Synechococcaceae cyanobacterium]|jgi:CBS domain-containing protein|nr:CBS domain-containing protein [Synechococcaceae cyanobacterium]